MPEYINKQEILEKAKSHQGNPFGIPAIIKAIENTKGVEIVRCKDCKYWQNKVFDPIIERHIGECHCSQWENDYFWCETSENDFCSYGERKE